MVKINDTTTFPNTTPALTDHVPGTDVSNTTNDANGETVTFTMQAIMDLFEANFAAPADFIDAITEIASALKTGSDGTLVTGTAGTSGDLVQWDANGDAVDGPTPPSGTIVGTTDTQTLSGKTVDGGSASSQTNAIQWRRDTAANFTSNNPTLAAGEVGYETDTTKFKTGDGSTAWTSLDYVAINAASIADVNTGTATDSAVTPDALAGSNLGTKEVTMLVFDDSEDVATGDGAGDLFFRVPSTCNGMNLVAVAAAVQTAGTTGTTDIQIHNVTQAADMLTTKITIDSAETDSSTAATAAVIDAANDDVATGDQIRIDVDAVSTTAPKGLLVELQFRLP